MIQYSERGSEPPMESFNYIRLGSIRLADDAADFQEFVQFFEYLANVQVSSSVRPTFLGHSERLAPLEHTFRTIHGGIVLQTVSVWIVTERVEDRENKLCAFVGTVMENN